MQTRIKRFKWLILFVLLTSTSAQCGHQNDSKLPADILKKAEADAEEKPLDADELKDRNKEFMVKFEQVKTLFTASLALYNTDGCACAYPRYQQLIGIDCRDYGSLFRCYDTELLIGMSRAYFIVEKSDRTDENTNEKWICKHCGSVYEYGWSDFSIYVERQKLELVSLSISPKGKPAIDPTPLFLGLIGHSYPSQSDIAPVDFETFEKYMTEQ